MVFVEISQILNDLDMVFSSHKNIQLHHNHRHDDIHHDVNRKRYQNLKKILADLKNLTVEQKKLYQKTQSECLLLQKRDMNEKSTFPTHVDADRVVDHLLEICHKIDETHRSL